MYTVRLGYWELVVEDDGFCTAIDSDGDEYFFDSADEAEQFIRTVERR